MANTSICPRASRPLSQSETMDEDTSGHLPLQSPAAMLEKEVHRLTEALYRAEELNQQNLQLLESARRRARLLEAGARVSRSITSILDLEALLRTTVDTICDEFGFYYAGVFLLDEAGRWATLRAGRGKAGAALIAEGYRLAVGGDSLIGVAIAQHQALIAPDGGAEEGRSIERPCFQNPHLPDTRSEMALPLVVGNRVLGALTVQSVEEAAFSGEDMAALQAMADQLAVAIENARLLKDLERTHQELMRARAYEVIASATGEAIHWVGNKAAPIPGSVARVSEDVTRYLVAAQALLADLPPELRKHKYAQLLAQAAEELAEQGVNLDDVRASLEAQSAQRLLRTLSAQSIIEDLAIIEESAHAILAIKEDLIGPARQRQDQPIALPDLLSETIASMGRMAEFVQTLFADNLPPVRADPIQLGRVFVNLIKNAVEAMADVADKRLLVWARLADDPGFVVVDFIDNGVGIPPDQIDKIWMAFYTTKGDRGGTGLGLPACAQIVGQLGGKITVESEAGQGSTFSVFLPAARE
jgi:signal transduction histidine kinase